MDIARPAAVATSPMAPRLRGSQNRRSTKWIIAGLLTLGVIPVALGIAHLVTVIAGVDVSPKALYFLRTPVPIAMHAIGAMIYVLLGPLQFSSGIRGRAPGFHRASGRLLVIGGFLVGVSALWMTLTLPHQASGGDVLYFVRLLFGAAMIVSIGLGFAAIRPGNVRSHRRWMTRGYAIGLGAVTQVPVLMIAQLVAGPPSDLARAILMGSAWIINLAIAEWALRRR